MNTPRPQQGAAKGRHDSSRTDGGGVPEEAGRGTESAGGNKEGA